MDDQAFNAFFEATRKPLQAYLWRVSGNAALAEDLLQESYLRFLAKPPASAEPGPRRAYLFTVALRLLQDHWRREAPRRWLPLPWRDEDPWPEPPCPEPGPEREALGLQEVALGFEALPPRQRSLLWLAYVEGLDHRELARAMAIREGSVKVLLHRARARMAAALGALTGGTP